MPKRRPCPIVPRRSGARAAARGARADGSPRAGQWDRRPLGRDPRRPCRPARRGGHQGRARHVGDALRAGWGGGGARRARLERAPPDRHARRPAPGCATSTPCTCSSPRARVGCASSWSSAPSSTPATACSSSRSRAATRCRGSSTPAATRPVPRSSGRSPMPPHALPRSTCTSAASRWTSSSRPGAAWGCGRSTPRGATGRAAGPPHDARHRWRRPALRGHDEPAGVDRRRHRDGAARRGRGGRRRVHAVPPDGDGPPEHAAAAALRGTARRGRGAARRARRAVHGRRGPACRPRAARHRRPRHRAAARRPRPRPPVARRHRHRRLPGQVPDDLAVGPERAPGPPGRLPARGAGRALPLGRHRRRPRRRVDAPGPVVVRRGGVLGRARRQPARVQLVARRPRVRAAHRRGDPRGQGRARGHRRDARDRPSRRVPATPRSSPGRRDHARGAPARDDRRRGRAARRGEPRGGRGDVAVDVDARDVATHEVRNLLAVARALVAVGAGTRGEPRHAHPARLPRDVRGARRVGS